MQKKFTHIAQIYKIFTFTMLLAAIVTAGWAQSGDVNFEHISIEQGLSQSSVFSIVQDTQGFLWFATQDGLNRYDGYTFVHYKNDPHDSMSISDNYVTTLFIDHAGVLWVGTRDGGLNSFDKDKGIFTRYRHQEGNPNSLTTDYIILVGEDHNGNLLVGTTNGISVLDAGRRTITRYLYVPGVIESSPMQITSLMVDRSGLVWIGKHGILMTFTPATGKFDTIATVAPLAPVDGLIQTADNAIWGSFTGLGVVDSKSHAIIPAKFQSGWKDDYAQFPQWTSVEDHAGNLWFGGDGGLYRIDRTHQAFTRYLHERLNDKSLSENAVLSLCVDKTGNLWVGTYAGINKYAPGRYVFKHYFGNTPESLSVLWTRIRSILELNDTSLLIGSDEGVGRFDPQTKTALHYLSKPGDLAILRNNSCLTSLKEDSAGTEFLWIGSNGGGLFKYRRTEKREWVFAAQYYSGNTNGGLVGPHISHLMKSRNGDIWVGTWYDGLSRYDRAAKRFIPYRPIPDSVSSLSHHDILSLYEDHTGTVWVGTGKGLNKFDPATNSFTHYFHATNDPSSISGDKVTSLCEDSGGTLWIGTYNGLNKFDREHNTFSQLTEADGLPDNVIYASLVDGHGNLWLSTNKGLSRFSVTTGKFKNFDVNDGLQSNEFNGGSCFKNSRGEMFFGGVNGFNLFNPDSIYDNPNVPAVVFVDFKLFNKTLRPGSGERRLVSDITQSPVVHLSYDDNVFTIGYAGLEFSAPAKNLYSYIMDGVDKSWNDVGTKREATYTHLDPGTYVFRVRASNNNGVWNEEGSVLNIVIEPPYWMTWWFRAIVVVFCLSVGPFIYYRRVTGLKREQILREEFSRNLIVTQEAERARIANDLHDSVGQQLLVLKNRLQLSLRGLPQDTDSSRHVISATEFASKAIEEIRSISHNLRPSLLDQFGVTTALEAVIESVAESSEINFTMNIENIDGLIERENEINIYRIVQEALNNIVKHSHATQGWISARRMNITVEVTIEDNGIGIPDTIIHSGEKREMFGITGMDERARMASGTLTIQQRANGGTTIRLAVPVNHGQTHD